MPSLLSDLQTRLNVRDVADVTRALVSIESHRDAPGRERPCAEKIAEIFTRWGFQPELVCVVEDRPNVYCRLKGSGGGKTLMLNGHIDTVPAYQMDIPPFQPFEENGLLYGRGSVDMKGGVACMMTALRLLRDLQVSLKGDVIFTGVINEEDRSEGTEYLVRNGPKADCCVVGEPSGLDIMVGHRGLEWLEFEFIGKASHGGTPYLGVNAISKAAHFIRRLEEQLMPELAKRVHPIIGPAVMNLGVIRGGMQPSTVADRCILQVDRRWLPQETLEQVLGEYQQIIRQMEIEDPMFRCTMKRMESNMATMDHYPLETPLDDPLVTNLKSVLSAMGIEPKISACGGWTDASLISNFAHIPSVVFGPGEISVAHSRCEYVPVEDLRLCTIAYALLAAEVCSQPAR